MRMRWREKATATKIPKLGHIPIDSNGAVMGDSGLLAAMYITSRIFRSCICHSESELINTLKTASSNFFLRVQHTDSKSPEFGFGH